MEYNIKHNEQENRFETEIEGNLCIIDYVKEGNTYTVTHTVVPTPVEGRGIAAALTKTLLDYIRDNHSKVVPQCTYTDTYIRRHPEYNDLLA